MEEFLKGIFTFMMTVVIIAESNTFQESCEVVSLPVLETALQDTHLVDHTFGTVYVRNKAFCFIQCMLDRRCCSLNYEKDIRLCHLNNETHITEPSSLKSTTDSKQYYPLEGINESIIGRCQNHDCPLGTTCTPLPYGSSQRFQCIYVKFANVQATSPTDMPETTTPEACIDGCNNCVASRSTVVDTISATPIGCFEAPGASNPLPTLLVNLRSNINWTEMHLTTEDCAQQAKAAGWLFFGIEFWAECWVSNTFDPSLFSKVRASDCATKCPVGFADENKMFVYEFL